MSKKIQRYFRKLSQQFSCNEDCLLILLFLYFFFFLNCFSTSVGLEDWCPKGSQKVREIQNIHERMQSMPLKEVASPSLSATRACETLLNGNLIRAICNSV